MTKLIFVFAQFCERAKQAGSFTALTGAKQWRLVLPVQVTVGKVRSGRVEDVKWRQGGRFG